MFLCHTSLDKTCCLADKQISNHKYVYTGGTLDLSPFGSTGYHRFKCVRACTCWCLSETTSGVNLLCSSHTKEVQKKKTNPKCFGGSQICNLEAAIQHRESFTTLIQMPASEPVPSTIIIAKKDTLFFCPKNYFKGNFWSEFQPKCILILCVSWSCVPKWGECLMCGSILYSGYCGISGAFCAIESYFSVTFLPQGFFFRYGGSEWFLFLGGFQNKPNWVLKCWCGWVFSDHSVKLRFQEKRTCLTNLQDPAHGKLWQVQLQ